MLSFVASVKFCKVLANRSMIQEPAAPQYCVPQFPRQFGEGKRIALLLEPLGQEQTKVTVVTKRRIQTNVFTTLTEGTFHIRFAKAVEIVKAGKPLPRTFPDESN